VTQITYRDKLRLCARTRIFRQGKSSFGLQRRGYSSCSLLPFPGFVQNKYGLQIVRGSRCSTKVSGLK